MVFEEMYKRYKDGVEKQSQGLVPTKKEEFLKMCVFFNECAAYYIEQYFKDMIELSQSEPKKDSVETVYDLLQKHQKLSERITLLAVKTNSDFGRDKGLWDLLSSTQKELHELEEKMKSIGV